VIDDEALNYIGDRLMTGDRNAGIALFELNVRDHPRSSRAHEFVAEAYAADGRNALAIQSYERAVALDRVWPVAPTADLATSAFSPTICVS